MLKNAKGLAILTVLKAGFLFSGRAGSGVIVARLPDGSWSAPSAIATAGAGVGGQIGAELTDFIFILNTQSAVDTFAQLGSVTLGTNVSIAAGPMGRNAEAAGTASFKSVSAVFSYSKTKGLFAGVSLEGSAIVERREANRKFYGNNCKGRQILLGQVEPPPGCEPLMRVLESKVFNSNLPFNEDDDDYYDDIPTTFSDDTASPSSRFRRDRRGSTRYDDYDDFSDDDDYGSNRRNGRSNSVRHNDNPPRYSSTGGGGVSRQATWEDDIYDNARSPRRENSSLAPVRPPTSLKPNFGSNPKTNANQAIALYTFKGERDGDLTFKKGDVIDIVTKTGTSDDWWVGRNNGVQGMFPANYVELI